MQKKFFLIMVFMQGVAFGSQEVPKKFEVGEIVALNAKVYCQREYDVGMIKPQPFLELNHYLVHVYGTDCSTVVSSEDLEKIDPKEQRLIKKNYKHRQTKK